MSELEELNVSGNQLSTLPASLGRLTKLAVLRVHSNSLHSLPSFRDAVCLRVLDIGHNKLLNVSVKNLISSPITLFDMTMNSQLKINEQEYKAVSSVKKICLVDVTSQDRPLPGLDMKTRHSSSDDHSPDVASAPWEIGFSECRGKQNRLCISTVRQLQFGSYGESLFGMFDGGTDAEVPQFIADHIADVLRSEVSRLQIPAHPLPTFVHQIPAKYMKYALLSMHRANGPELKTTHIFRPIRQVMAPFKRQTTLFGQVCQSGGTVSKVCRLRLKLQSTGRYHGAAAVLVHLQRRSARQFVMTTANVGDVEVVLCRQGDAICLTRKFVTSDDRTECQRICKLDGFITADGKVNGATRCTRLLGCSYLHPHVIPDPHVNSVALGNDDEFVVIGNATLWSHVTPVEAVAEIRDVFSPVSAAKRLRDLAQGCGAQTNIAVMVIRLDAKPGSTAAAAAATTPPAVSQQKYPAPTVQVRESRDQLALSDVTDASPSPIVRSDVGLYNASSFSTSSAGGSNNSSLQSAMRDDDFVRAAISIEGAKRPRHQRSAAAGVWTSTPTTAKSATCPRFVKKAAGARDVELRQTSPSGSLSSGSSGRPPSRGEEQAVHSTGIDLVEEDLPSATVRAAATPEPADSAAASSSDVVRLTSSSSNVGRSVTDRVAVFEISSGSSSSLSSVGVIPTSQRRLPSSEDGRPTSSSAGDVSARRPRRRAHVTSRGKYQLNTSVDGGGVTTAVSAAADDGREPREQEEQDTVGSQDEQSTAVTDEEPIFDVTRL